MGFDILNFGSAYVRMACLVVQAKKLVFNNLTPLLAYFDLSIEKTLGDFVLILINLRVYFMINSNKSLHFNSSH